MPSCSWVTKLVNNSAKEWCGKMIPHGEHFCEEHKAMVTKEN